ncbi:MAG: hypothetical protein K6G49_02625 [Candidatus Saccharibacteria bacterium]|nr:hypothetical protein [Candidatus Saccharibacteria bacterium]
MVIHESNIKSLSIIFGAFLIATLLSGTISLNNNASADTNEVDTVNVDILAACTMARTDSTGGNYSASLIPGQSVELGPTSVKTICNDNNGYAIYAIGYSGNAYTGATHTDLISATNTSYNIHTNTPSAAGSSSYWAMKLASVASGNYTPTIENSYSSYNVIPNTYTKVVSLNKATDAGAGATGSNFNATYEIKAASDQVADSYTGKVKYVLVHPNSFAPGTYSIAYNANGGSGTMTGESGISNMAEHTLITNAFAPPSGYGFAGWCTIQDTSQTPQTTCSGETYTDRGTVEPGTIAANSTLNLYAIWEVDLRTYMQDFTLAQCQAQAADAPLIVYDRRDKSDYTVRYINGACWMTQNLRITGTISATNSNFSSPASINTAAGGDLRGSSSTYTEPQSHLADSTDVEASTSAPEGPYTITQLGAWYNYCATSAGQSCSQTMQSATQDICPANWHLPSEAQFNSISSYGSNLSVFPGGYYNNGSITAVGIIGYWWSATAHWRNDQYYLFALSSSEVGTGYYDKYAGLFIRCMRDV